MTDEPAAPQDDEYVYYDDDPDVYKRIYSFCFRLNLYLEMISILINLFHLSILSRKELRANSVYKLMIAICVCDIVNFVLDVYQTMIELYWIPDYFPLYAELCLRRDYAEVSVVYYAIYATMDITKRYSVWLAILMALIRTLSVLFPMNRFIQNMSRPRNTGRAMRILFVFWLCYSTWHYTTFRIFWLPDNLNTQCQNGPSTAYKQRYVLAMPMSLIYLLSNLGYIEVIMKFIPTVCYPILTVSLLLQLRKIKTRRENLKRNDDGSDNTTKLILFMTVSFMLTEGLAGLQGMFMYNYEALLLWNEDFAYSIATSQYALNILRTVNATSHSFICFLMSSQYRDTFRSLFFKNQMERKTILVEETNSYHSVSSKKSRSVKMCKVEKF
ncbi:unnamed protein product [Caenorhabditis sp. 36 PRJEB53466]|nr:unnamed protein product [Caenorhabditis sp. 36 PRJEB53466]